MRALDTTFSDRRIKMINSLQFDAAERKYVPKSKSPKMGYPNGGRICDLRNDKPIKWQDSIKVNN